MPDITMCNGGDCPLKAGCYRFTAIPSGRQSYFATPPFRQATCAEFIANYQYKINQAWERQARQKH